MRKIVLGKNFHGRFVTKRASEEIRLRSVSMDIDTALSLNRRVKGKSIERVDGHHSAYLPNLLLMYTTQYIAPLNTIGVIRFTGYLLHELLLLCGLDTQNEIEPGSQYFLRSSHN